MSLRLSASAISDFKACPYRLYLKYILGVRPKESTDSQRIGSVWHKCLEIFWDTANKDEDKDALISDYLNKVYEDRPSHKTPEEWETERITLLYMLAGYKWYYQNQEFEVVATEISFDVPLRDPDTDRILLDCALIGKIDKVIRFPNGIYQIMEHKTTSKSIDSGSDLWGRLRLNTQKNIYVMVARYLQQAGELGCVEKDAPLISECLFDYMHKPTISPKKLTQSDSKKFVTDGEYCGQKFEILAASVEHTNEINFTVNGVQPEVEPGAKEGTFAIRETAEMFGARLLQDITVRPEFYFARKPIDCSDDTVENFRKQLYNIVKVIQRMEKCDWWYTNESQCEATFKCPFTSFCYNGVKPDINNLPNQFRLMGEHKDGSKTTGHKEQTADSKETTAPAPDQQG